MAKSTLMGIMGRMACYTGQAITWRAGAQFARGPDRRPRYEWGPLPDAAGGRPGVTPFS